VERLALVNTDSETLVGFSQGALSNLHSKVYSTPHRRAALSVYGPLDEDVQAVETRAFIHSSYFFDAFPKHLSQSAGASCKTALAHPGKCC